MRSTVYDPTYVDTGFETASAVDAEFGMSREEKIKIVRFLSAKFIATRANVDLTFEMDKSGRKKEESVETNVFCLVPMPTLFLFSVPDFPATGEMVCLEMAKLLGYYDETEWNDVKADKWNYRALVMTRVIQFLYKEGGSRYLAGTKLDAVSDWSKDLATDAATLRFKELVKHKVLQDIFLHDSEKAVHEAVSTFYGPWPEEACSLCGNNLWDQESLVMTRECCEDRLHANCLKNVIDKRKDLHGCRCNSHDKKPNASFLVLDRCREVRAAVWSGDFKDWKVFMDHVVSSIRKEPPGKCFDGSVGYEYIRNFELEETPPEMQQFQHKSESRLKDPPLPEEERIDSLETTEVPWDTIQWKKSHLLDIVERTKKNGLSTLSEEDVKEIRKHFDFATTSCLIMRNFSDMTSFDFAGFAACKDIQKFENESVDLSNYYVQRFDISDDGSISSRRFQQQISFEEFNRYLNARKTYLVSLQNYGGTGQHDDDRAAFKLGLRWYNDDEVAVDFEEIHLGKTILYLLDVDLNESCFDAFMRRYSNAFCYNEFFPRGSNSLLQWLDEDEAPALGPNLYVASAGAITSAHIDGNSTVDALHHCISGTNEIVMLPSLDPAKSAEAMSILFEGTDIDMTGEDLVRKAPHIEEAAKIKWPTNATINKLKDKGIDPLVFLLEPGDILFIPRNCIHMFRKMSHEKLSEHDCHFRQRQEHHQAHGTKPGEIFISIAWDWCSVGTTGLSFKAKLRSLLEADDRNRERKAISLLKPSCAMLQMAYSCLKSSSHILRSMVLHNAYEAIRKIYDREHDSLKQLIGLTYSSIAEPDIENSGDYFSYEGSVYSETSYMCKECNAEICHFYMKIDGKSEAYCVQCAVNESLKLDSPLQLRRRYFTCKKLAFIVKALFYHTKAIEALPDEDCDNGSKTGGNLENAGEVAAANCAKGSNNLLSSDKQSTNDTDDATSLYNDQDYDREFGQYVSQFTLRGKNLRNYESEEEQPSHSEIEQDQSCHVDYGQEQASFLDPEVFVEVQLDCLGRENKNPDHLELEEEQSCHMEQTATKAAEEAKMDGKVAKIDIINNAKNDTAEQMEPEDVEVGAECGKAGFAIDELCSQRLRFVKIPREENEIIAAVAQNRPLRQYWTAKFKEREHPVSKFPLYRFWQTPECNECKITETQIVDTCHFPGLETLYWQLCSRGACVCVIRCRLKEKSLPLPQDHHLLDALYNLVHANAHGDVLHVCEYLRMYQNLIEVIRAHDTALLSRTFEPIKRDINEHIASIHTLIRQKVNAIRNPILSPEDKILAEATAISLEETKMMARAGYTMTAYNAWLPWKKRTWKRLQKAGFDEWPVRLTLESVMESEEEENTRQVVNEAALEEYDDLANEMDKIRDELKIRQELPDDPTLVVAALKEMVDWGEKQLEALKYTLRNMDL